MSGGGGHCGDCRIAGVQTSRALRPDCGPVRSAGRRPPPQEGWEAGRLGVGMGVAV